MILYAAPDPSVKPFFPYPGGKTKSPPLLEEILFNLCYLLTPSQEYREPFVGGGGVFLNLAHHLKDGQRVWLNDKDKSVACLWVACQKWPEELISRAKPYWKPSEALWRVLVSRSKQPIDPADAKDKVLESASARLIVQYWGYNGGKNCGTKPMTSTRAAYSSVAEKIWQVHRILNRFKVKITAVDYQTVLNAKGPALLYADPPYYRKGGKSYNHYFAHPDHERFKNALDKVKYHWVLSYDDCPEIRTLYGVPKRIPGLASPEPLYAQRMTLRYQSGMNQRYYNELILTTHKTANKVDKLHDECEERRSASVGKE